MSILSSDLSRNFGIGFLIGAFLVGAMSVQSWDAEITPSAMASTVQVEESPNP